MKRTFILLLIVMTIAAALSGCSGFRGLENTVEDNGTSKEDPNEIADYLEIKNLLNQEYLVFKSTQSYYTVGEEWKELLLFNPTEEMEVGEFARITADVDVLNGGLEGFTGNVEIKKLLSIEVLDWAQLISVYEFTEATPDSYYFERMLSCQYGEKIYYVFPDNGDFNVYLDGKLYKTYANGDFIDNVFVYYSSAVSWDEVKAEYDQGTRQSKDFFVTISDDSIKTTENLGEMYMKEFTEADIVTDEETGISYVKNQLLISAEPGTTKEHVEGIVKELDAEIVGCIELTSDFQIEFNEDQDVEAMQAAADYISSFPFVINVTVNTVSEIDTE